MKLNRGLWCGLMLGSLGLMGCGSLGSAPTPAAGDLLGAPATLNLGGQVLRLTANPQLSQEMNRFRVRVAVKASGPATRAAAPATLKVTGLYVVTPSGLWQSPQLNDVSQARNCLASICAQGSGGASGFAAGDDVRVIAQLKDASGRTYWLRDAQSRNVVAQPLVR
ncbi:hypothetical protein [Deinococcus humi]|uniref:Lipoprotein n=1 Tax=Deinococcus humi TaxID=662880 RepID=A0A7W8K0V2_9DEIO|nr:hypothetical protein [Deinococcus humi]MBB5365169.1 hypothetical protein [Deinococcus humi]GGO37729.1 hypothetical protein GCM10008949_43220 [Deinococcus humi]